MHTGLSLQSKDKSSLEPFAVFGGSCRHTLSGPGKPGLA